MILNNVIMGSGENLDAEFAIQDDLIAQIATALEGQTSASGGGAEIETCTVTLTDYDPRHTRVIYSKLVDGVITTCNTLGGGTIYTDVVCGTVFCVANDGNDGSLSPASPSGYATFISEIAYVDMVASYIVYGDCTINME